MAAIDYGALLRVKNKNENNWTFINRDSDLFMKASDTGYVCEKAVDKKDRNIDIAGNYFAYAGDSHFLLAFYKGTCEVISDGKILHTFWGADFNSETRYFDNLPSVKISRLSTKYDYDKLKSWGPWQNYVKENYFDVIGNEKLYELQNGYNVYHSFLKYAKKLARYNKNNRGYKHYPFRFLAEWEYDGRKYEVIYGYGIDNQKEVWDSIKNTDIYDFKEKEIQIIDNWFS